MSTLPGSVIVLVAIWVALVRCLDKSPWTGCDNGKVLLDTDLPKDAANWDCPTPLWPESERLYNVDTEYDPEPAKLTCMDQHITFNHTIPNSGAFRPVGADSGEYFFCPPQRWLNSLHRGATVFLYHPCSPLDERLLLSALARSCISDYILTPFKNLDRKRPIALVSWGRTLEVSTAASFEICDWLNTTSSRKTNAEEMAHEHHYNLLLTRSVEQDKHKMNKGSLKQCCEQTISSLTKNMKVTQLPSNFQTRSLKHIKEREKRAAIGSTTNLSKISSNQTSKVIHKLQSDGLPETSSSQNTVDQRDAKDILLKENPLPKMSNISQSTTNDIHLIHPQGQLQKSSSSKMEKNHNIGNATIRSKVFKPIAKQRGGVSKVAANSKDNEVINVEGRETDNINNDAKSQQSGLNGSESLRKSHPVISVASDGGDCQCKVDQPCECGNGAGAAGAGGVRGGFQRTPRTDEAVWAAGALAFILVLLTLSILHTRLYKHWRRGTSLYWHDPRQDYDSVADVIRRRLRLAKKRRKRSRKKECVLLPTSSSSEEYP